MPKVLVVGGAGYIGSHVVKELLENGFETVVYDNLSTGQEINLFKESAFIKADILDEKALDNAMKQNIDAVIHLAAKKAVGESMENPQLYSVNNLTGTINILNAMINNNVKHIVFSSSAAVYGMPQYLPLDENHSRNPMSFYGYTKAAIEDLMDWYSKLKDFNYIALRYFNAVGYAADKSIVGKEKNPQNLLPIIMEVATGKREKFSIYGSDYDTPDGTCLRDYIHVTDLATAHVLAVKKLISDKKSYCLNLGTGKATSVKEIVDATENIIGKRLNYNFAPRRSGDPAVVVAKAQTATKILGWKPKYTNIEDIIKTTWNIEN
ncbi:MAG: UDP-glucose 4-epimerase GalE [Alphaproteobacteria bacterium]|nr:UDP-glucose 4-epimerase GalE [Alphaproteobacteria bacterium]